MKEFECINTRAAVQCHAVHVFLDALGNYKKRGEKMLAQHFGTNILEAGPNDTMNMEKYLGLMAEVKQQFGDYFLRRMGERIWDRFTFPPNIKSVPDFMAMLDEVYHTAHVDHDDQIGHFRWEQTGANKGTLIEDDPYPCTFNIGLLVGSCRRWSPAFAIREDESLPCRGKGGDSCTYYVEW